MPRRKLSRLGSECCYHITQRCQEKQPLLRFKKDRQQYRERLLQASRKYPVAVLSYMVTRNHIHLLLWAEKGADVSAAMQYVSGTAAQDYNNRKEREGSFWSMRFHPTLVQDGAHLSRCLIYMGLNMVRAGTVKHPSSWDADAYAELVGLRQRRLIVDRQRLLNCLNCGDPALFTDWYERTLATECGRGELNREPFWTEAAAVGDREWVEQRLGCLPRSWYKLERVEARDYGMPGQDTWSVSETGPTYAARMGHRRRQGLLRSLAAGERALRAAAARRGHA